MFSCVGFCIGLGERFFDAGVARLMTTIIPLLQLTQVSPRVIPSYAIPLWLAQQVLHILCMYPWFVKRGSQCVSPLALSVVQEKVVLFFHGESTFQDQMTIWDKKGVHIRGLGTCGSRITGHWLISP